MTLPTRSDVHVDSTLTNISIAYLQDSMGFISRRVFPNVPVEHQSDEYFLFDRGDFNRDQAEKRAPNAESAGGGYRLSTASYSADVWAMHKDVPDQILNNADQAVPQMRAATEWVMHQLMIRQERQFASTYLTGAVWDNDFDGVASSAGSGEVIQWSDGTNSDPIGDIRSAKTTVQQNTGLKPNTLILGSPDVMNALEDHPDIVDRVKYAGGLSGTSPAMVNEQTLAQLFGVDRVMVGEAVYNSAAEGATDSHSFIGGKTALLTYSAPNPGIMIPSAGYTFSWSNYLGQSNEFGVASRSFRIEKQRSERVEGEIAFDMKLVSSALGYFWDSIVA